MEKIIFYLPLLAVLILMIIGSKWIINVYKNEERMKVKKMDVRSYDQILYRIAKKVYIGAIILIFIVFFKLTYILFAK